MNARLVTHTGMDRPEVRNSLAVVTLRFTNQPMPRTYAK